MKDLVEFFYSNNLTKFSFDESGYRLCVQVPSTFEIDNNIDDAHRGMMRLKIRVFHLDLNRNGSFVSEQAAKEAMPTIKNRPILAYIHQLDNGEWDFETHNMSVRTDDDGKEYYEYDEKQIGSFTEEDPFFEYDEELDKVYVCAYAYISEDYTRACDILRSKGGTKNSVELQIEDLAFNAKDKYLELKKFYISASTLLGSYDDGTEVREGMLGSRADIVDFSEKNNSILFNNQNFINQIADAVVLRLSNKAETSANNNIEEGGKDLSMFDELLKKYNITIDDITFEYESLTDEELEAKFAEVFESGEKFDDEEGAPDVSGSDPSDVSDEPNSDSDSNPDEPGDDDSSDNESDDDDPGDDEPGDDGDDDGESDLDKVNDEKPDKKKKKYTVQCGDKTFNFSISLSEILSSMSELVNATYSESDNDWYMVDVYDQDKYVVFVGCWTGAAYRQSYKVRNDVYSLVGDRIPVKQRYVTADEEAELDKMKNNYSAIEAKLQKYESEPEKIIVLKSEDYATIRNSNEYIELLEEKNHFDLSVEEVKNKLDDILLSYAKAGKLEFASDNDKKYPSVKKLINNSTNKKSSRYGNLFADKK